MQYITTPALQAVAHASCQAYWAGSQASLKPCTSICCSGFAAAIFCVFSCSMLCGTPGRTYFSRFLQAGVLLFSYLCSYDSTPIRHISTSFCELAFDVSKERHAGAAITAAL